MGLRLITGGITLFIAESFPFFGDIQSLIGGGAVGLIAFIFPTVFYVKIFRRELSEMKIAICVGVALLGIVVGGTAVFFALVDIYHNSKKYHLFG